MQSRLLVEAKTLLAVMLVLAPPTLRCLQAAVPPQSKDQQAALQQPAVTLAGCPDRCGNLIIPYPFGSKAGCFIPGFEVVCNDTFNPPRLFIANPGLQKDTKPIQSIQDYYRGEDTAPDEAVESLSLIQLTDISTKKGKAWVYAAFSFVCNTARAGYLNRTQIIDTTNSSPFIFSNTSNVLVGIGHDVLAQLDSAWPGTAYGTLPQVCRSFVTPPASPTNGSCAGLGCCQSSDIPQYFECATVTAALPGAKQKAGTCSYSMLVERSWYNFSVPDLEDGDIFIKNNPMGVPVVLDFAIRTGACPAAGQPFPKHYYPCSGNSSCVNSTDNKPAGYLCKCWDGYDGNPYIPNGCQDIDECAIRKQSPELQHMYPCSSGGICKNTKGSYDCPCGRWMKGDGKTGTCTEQFPFAAKVALGILAAVVLALVLLLLQEKQKTRKFFAKNGGYIIMKHVNNLKFFKKKEVRKITGNYSDVLGKGAFGEVYKGSLDDKRLVAVKRSIRVNEEQKEQFANEIIIQSRIIHKNIVKLIGCCLEVDVPMLVYEFVPRGSLHDTLHGCNKVHLSLDERLVIAAETADGLAYMHFKTPTIILHGDVKPSNILLDDNLFPRISDFGISKLIPIEDQHDEKVIGDLTYMDPVYRETGLLTTKSDVYSFGVVLLELITREQATLNLIKSFVATYTRESAQDKFLDKDISEENGIKVLHAIAEIAIECLKDNVDERPDITKVAERLQNIRGENNK